MYRNAYRWASRSFLMDSWIPRWLADGGEPTWRKTVERHDDGAQLAASLQPTAKKNHSAPVDSPDNHSALSEQDAEQRGGLIDDTDDQGNVNHVSLPDAFAGARTNGHPASRFRRG